MVRHRITSKQAFECPNSNLSDCKGKKSKQKSSGIANIPTVLKVLSVFGSAIGVSYFAYRGYLETRVYSPLNVPKVTSKNGLAVPAKFWGSYRPGVYFGLKTRSPADILTGLMWMLPEKIEQQNIGLRHWCEQGDNLDSFGWNKHDGKNFGVQTIRDRGLELKTSFVKWTEPKDSEGLTWSARIEAVSKNKRKSGSTVSLFFYAGFDEGGEGTLNPMLSTGNYPTGISGSSSSLGNFEIEFSATNGTESQMKHIFHSATESPGPHKFTETVMQRLRIISGEKVKGLPIIGLDANLQRSENPNFVVYQVIAELPFQLDVHFRLENSSEYYPVKTEDDLTDAIKDWSKIFDQRFEQTFQLEAKGYDKKSIEFAQHALSNLIGGVGYFHGHSIVQSKYSKQAVKYWDSPLYTAVPSRSFFPRGFLWDEGFHNLLISKWDPEISADILGHWLDLINVEGWIPREQILGLEARAKVPAEFVVQRNENANPPTLILTLHSMIKDFRGPDGNSAVPDWFTSFLNRMWPRLEIWYSWFNTTQTGPVQGSYRWRGRNGSAIHELNPKTLTSGLDDFPRASHPSEDERHIDLRCWMALASALMADIAQIIGKEKESVKYGDTAKFLHDNKFLDELHWSDEYSAYLDYGLHTEGVALERPVAQHPGQRPEKIRVTRSEPRLQFVNQFGYVGLFPFLLQIVDPKSQKLGRILSDLEDPHKMFTPYGLRSLSKGASLYMKRNTEHDASYWRGPIWININYLAVRALHFYANRDGPYKHEAARIHDKLKSAIVENVVREYHRTGYIWEQYNDKTGHGQGCRPFTGWSTLVVLIMGDRY